MQGRDVIGVAATGSGKTLAFLLLGPILRAGHTIAGLVVWNHPKTGHGNHGLIGFINHSYWINQFYKPNTGVGGLEHLFFFQIFGISSSQLTKSIIYQRGGSTTNQIGMYITIVNHY
jgi:hypothetical protein